MARDFSRTHRIADQIQKDLSVIIQQEMKDPRIGLVTINSVKVSKDLSFADVYYTSMVLDSEDEKEAAEVSQNLLNNAQSFLRTLLAQSIQLRVMPQLRFHYDFTLSNGLKMDRLIREARDSDKNIDG